MVAAVPDTVSSVGSSPTVVGSPNFASNDCVITISNSKDTDEHNEKASQGDDSTAANNQGGSGASPAAHHVLNSSRCRGEGSTFKNI